jgi:hypothetical protein
MPRLRRSPVTINHHFRHLREWYCAVLLRIVRAMMFAAIWLPRKIQISYNFPHKVS